MKTILLIITILSVYSMCISQSSIHSELYQSVSEESLKENMYYLAGDACQGRLSGSHGDSVATEYVENWMKKYELTPGFANSYRQAFEFTFSLFGTEELIIDGKSLPKDDKWWYFPLSYASTNEILIKDAPLVFVNYGFATDKYNDYDNVDVKGKVVINLESAHQYLKDSILTYEELKSKVKNFGSKGALAALYFPINFDYNELAPQLKLESSAKFGFLKGEKNYNTRFSDPIPDILTSKEVIRELLGDKASVIDSLSYSLNYLKNDPQAFDLDKKVSIHIKKSFPEAITNNIIASIEGTDTSAGYILVIAHRDHLGKDHDNTFYGADDNASGTVALMECAKAISMINKAGVSPKRGIIFVSIAAEEQFLLGSTYFSEHPTIPLDKIGCVVNIDMIGKTDIKHEENPNSDKNYIYPLYYDSLYNFRPILDNVGKQTGIIVDDYYFKNPNEDYMISRSDHSPFGAKGVPFIWLFSGIHNYYHLPTDNPERIDYKLLTDRTKFTLGVIWNVAII